MAMIQITASAGRMFDFDELYPTLNISYNGKNATVNVPNLSSPKQEEEFRWYFEEYIEQDPFLSSRATSALNNLKTYGVKLSNAIIGTGLITEAIVEKGLEIQIEEDIPAKSALYCIHWEILEWIDVWRVNNPLQIVTVTRTCRRVEMIQTTDPSSEFRVLVLAARPEAGNDVPHRLVSRIIQNVIDQIQSTPGCSAYEEVTMDIVSPGTFGRLREWIGRKAKGYYNLVHLDVHGYEIKSQSLLSFLPEANGKDARVSGDQLVCIFRDAGVSRVFMNACGSARSVKTRTNIATALIQGGVSEVIGMSFKVTASAVEFFTFEAYKALLIQGCSLAEAAARGRQSLRECRTRMTKFGHGVEAVDSPIPVCYAWDRADCMMSKDIMETSCKKFKPNISLKEMTLLGREEDILDLESAFLCENPVVLLVGQAGIGKSCLLEHLHWWWKRTSIVERSAYIDLRNIQSLSLEHLDTCITTQFSSNSKDRKDATLHDLLKQDRCLLILDGIESLPRNNQRQLGDLMNFLEDLRDAAKGNSLILLASRRNEPWLRALDQKAPRKLRGLRTLHGVQLASKCLPINDRSKAQTREDFEYLQRIVELLSGNPLALQLVMQHARTRMLPKEYYDGLLRGDPIKVDEEWFSTATGATSSFVDACGEVELLENRITLEFQEMAANRRIISFNRISILSMFWGPIEINTLPLYFRLWILHTIRSDRTKYSLDEFAAKPDVLYSMGELPYEEFRSEIEGIVEDLIEKIVDSGFFEELGRDASTQPSNSYYRINPLLVLALRQGEHDRCRRSVIETAMVSYHLMRPRVWASKRHATLPNRQFSAMELHMEFSNFLVAARMLHDSGIHTFLDLIYLSNLVEPLMRRGYYLEMYRFPLLIELAQCFLQKLLDVLKNDDTWDTLAMVSEKEYSTSCMPRNPPLELPTKWLVLFTKVAWRIHALGFAIQLHRYHDYLATRARDDYEAIILRLSNYNILEDPAIIKDPAMLKPSLLPEIPKIVTGYAAMFEFYREALPRRVSDCIRPADDDDRIIKAYSRLERQMSEISSASPCESMDSENRRATLVSDLDNRLLLWGYPGFCEELDNHMWSMRSKWQYVKRAYTIRKWSKRFCALLDKETNHHGNHPKNICILFECLAILDAANGNWLDAVVHLRNAHDYEDSMEMELSLQRSGQRGIRMAEALFNAGDRHEAYRLLLQVFNQENSKGATPKTSAVLALSFARTRIACRADSPISPLVILIFAAKAAYCGHTNNALKEGYFLKELHRVSKERVWWYEWRARRYESPSATVNFNLCRLFVGQIFQNDLLHRMTRIEIPRRNQPDSYAASDEVLAEAEQHLFSSPNDALQTNHFKEDIFEGERALFHRIYECSTNFSQCNQAESCPRVPFVATDGVMDTTPSDDHFPMQIVMGLAGYSPYFDDASPTLEVQTSFLRIMWHYYKEIWAKCRHIYQVYRRATSR